MARKVITKPETLEIKAQKRKLTGRKVKTLRREGTLPANIYGKKVSSLAIQVPIEDFLKVFKQAGETGIVELKLNGQIRPALIHNVQFDPITDTPIHADFLQVNLAEKVSATVPIEIMGDSPAEKAGEGILVQQMNEIEVEALPRDLPEKFMVDVSGLSKIDDVILVNDLPVDKSKVTLKSPTEQIVVKVEPPAKEEEVAPPPPAEGVVPAEEAPAVEGEVPASEGEEGSQAPPKEEG